MTDTYTLPLHDALPISRIRRALLRAPPPQRADDRLHAGAKGTGLQDGDLHEQHPRVGAAVAVLDRKSTRLNSSHEWISYAVFCLKKKKTTRVCSSTLPH